MALQEGVRVFGSMEGRKAERVTADAGLVKRAEIRVAVKSFVDVLRGRRLCRPGDVAKVVCSGIMPVRFDFARAVSCALATPTQELCAVVGGSRVRVGARQKQMPELVDFALVTIRRLPRGLGFWWMLPGSSGGPEKLGEQCGR